MNGRGLRALAVLVLALLLAGIVLSVSWPDGELDQNSNEDVGRALFGETDVTGYALVLFLVGILLLVALLGGIFLAKEERE